MKVDVYKTTGKKGTGVEVADTVFAAPWRPELAHQVITAMMANRRQGGANTKDRSEVSGGGKKPWKQKGTGRARHGSRRSPIWVGGGATFGPRSEKDYSQKINKKMRTGALATLLSAKVRDAEVLFVESFQLEKAATKAADQIMLDLATVDGFATLNTRTNPNNVLVIVPHITDTIGLSFRNLPHVRVVTGDHVNAHDVATARYIIISDPVAVNELLTARVAGTFGEAGVEVSNSAVVTENA